MPYNIQKDFINPTEKEIQQALSYNRLIPSEHFKGNDYMLFLEYAKPYELDQDIISEETFYKIFPKTRMGYL